MSLENLKTALAQAESMGDLGERTVVAVGELIPCHAANFAPIWESPEDAEGWSLLFEGKLAPEVIPVVQQSLARLMQEVSDIEFLFQKRDRTVEVERVVGWSKYRRTRCYNEYLRQFGVERQYVVGLGTIPRPLGFLAACRSEKKPPLNSAERACLREFQRVVAQAMVPFHVSRRWDGVAEDLLQALAAGVPIPSFLWTHRGRLAWLNVAAERRLGILAMRYGSRRYYAGSKQTLEDLWRCAQRELDTPGWNLTRGRDSLSRWMVPGEELVVRRVPSASGSPYSLVCFVPLNASGPPDVDPWPCADPPAPAGPTVRPDLQCLSPRETEVAVLAANGYTALNIAARLGIAESTVQSHMKRIYRKLDVRTRVELALRVLGTRRR